MEKFGLGQLNDEELYFTIQTYLNVHFALQDKIPQSGFLRELFYVMITSDDIFVEGIEWFEASTFNTEEFYNSISSFHPTLCDKIKEHTQDFSLKDNKEEIESFEEMFEELDIKVTNWIKKEIESFDFIISDLENIFWTKIAKYTRE